MKSTISHFQKFRQELYSLFSNRADATMDTIDCLSGQTNADSVVKLSLSELYPRTHDSLYASIQNFFQQKMKH